MKFRVKMYCTAAVVVLAAIVTISCLLIFSNRETAVAGQSDPAKHSKSKPGKVKYSGIELERYSNYQESFSGYDDNFNANKLAADLQTEALRIFKAVLPEKSSVIMPLDIELVDDHSARVSGRAVVFSAQKAGEKVLRCQVMINFLADGSCEADYPGFFSE